MAFLPVHVPDLGPASGPPTPSALDTTGPVSASHGVELPPPILPALQRELEAIIRDAGSPDSRWGVLAISLDRGDTLLALNPRGSFTPASNMKVLTTAASLHFLGPEFRFRTFLLADGQVSEGVLHGDLVLYGTGDPTFSERFHESDSAVLDSLVTGLVQTGIRQITGGLVVDGSYFSGPTLHPEWDPSDFNDAFAAPISAVSVAENLVTLRVAPGPWAGAPAAVYLKPEGSGLQVRNEVRTTNPGTRTRVWLARDDPADPIGIEGEMPLRRREVWRRLPVPDPYLFAGRQMVRALEKAGVRVQGGIRTVQDPSRSAISALRPLKRRTQLPVTVLSEHQSPPLLDLLPIVNKQSNNFYAESVMKTLGRIVRGDGSFSGGSEVVEEYVTEVVGLAPESVTIRDGSGLSPANRVSPEAMVGILEYLARSKDWDAFLGTLPRAGIRRELRRMYRTPAAGNLRAKTGTMDRVSALSGVVTALSGERILFSVLSNGVASERRAKRAEDRIGVALAALNRPPVDRSDMDR